MKIAIVVPHFFMQDYYLKNAIFSPGFLAIDLATELAKLNNYVTLFSPKKVTLPKNVKNIVSDYSLIQKELDLRGYGLNELMQKHPLTYITFARQMQSQLIDMAYKMANDNKFDLIHIYINEEDVAMQFANLCNKPIVFTHHEPFNFLTRYKTSFAKFKDLNWISISYSQQKTIDVKMNWVANIYHGIELKSLQYLKSLKKENYKEYFLYLGRIIEPKGVHLAIDAIKEFNIKNKSSFKLKIAGKHYSNNDSYWEEKIQPFIDNNEVEYIGFINDDLLKDRLLYNAKALLMPSTWEEPFGMVILESLRCGTPVVGLKSGALAELIEDNLNGFLSKVYYSDLNKVDEIKTVKGLLKSMQKIDFIKSSDCINFVANGFSKEIMAKNHLKVYRKLLSKMSYSQSAFG